MRFLVLLKLELAINGLLQILVGVGMKEKGEILIETPNKSSSNV